MPVNTKPPVSPSDPVSFNLNNQQTRDKTKTQTQTQTTRLGTAVSFALSTLTPSFDILSELATNRDAYKGETQLSIYSFPEYLRTCLDRVRSRVDDKDRIGLPITLSCCIHCGFQTLSSHEDIRSLIKLKRDFDQLDNVDAWTLQEVASIFSSFPLSLPDNTLSQTRKQNLTLHDNMKDAVYSLCGDLGASFSIIGTLCVMIALSDQPAVLPETQQQMEVAIEGFFKRVTIRKIVLERLLRLFTVHQI